MKAVRCDIKHERQNSYYKHYNIEEILRHELKNQISSNAIMLNLLFNGRFGKLDDIQKEILLHSVASLENILLILNNFLIYNTLEDNRFLISEDYDIKSIISSVADDLNFIIRDKKQTICIDCNCESSFVNINKKDINRIFYNLVVNMAELSDEGSQNVISVREKSGKTEVLFINKTYKNKCPSCINKVKYNKFRKISTDLSFDLCKMIIKRYGGEIYINTFGNLKYVYKAIFNTAR